LPGRFKALSSSLVPPKKKLIHSHVECKNTDLIGAEGRMVTTRGWGKREDGEKKLPKGYKFAVRQEE
jgi:hypothetical protein